MNNRESFPDRGRPRMSNDSGGDSEFGAGTGPQVRRDGQG